MNNDILNKKRRTASDERRCSATTIKNEQCPYQHVEGSLYCKKHKEGTVTKIPEEIEKCEALTNKLQQCPFKHAPDSIYCVKHTKKRDFGTIHEPYSPKKKIREIPEEESHSDLGEEWIWDESPKVIPSVSPNATFVMLSPPPLRFSTTGFSQASIIIYKCQQQFIH